MTTREKVIPESVVLAAKRAFVRTTAQAYAATIPTGAAFMTLVLTLFEDPSAVTIVTTVVVPLVSPLLAGLAAYFMMMEKIPVEYTDAVLDTAADAGYVTTPERLAVLIDTHPDVQNSREGTPSGDDTFGPPPASASKLRWVTYAEGLGISTSGLTKDQIRQAVEALNGSGLNR